jgi:hypothetical protein
MAKDSCDDWHGGFGLVIKLFDEAFDELIIPAPVLQAARAAKIS